MPSPRGCFASSALLLAPAIAAQEPVPPPDALVDARDRIVNAVEGGEVPSVAVLVLQRGRVVWAEAFGLADTAARRQATLTTAYPIGAISEVLTATGVMLLVDRGQLEVDKPINGYLPGVKLRTFDGPADSLTLNQVLHQSASLPGHRNEFGAGETVPSLEQTLAAYGVTSGISYFDGLDDVSYVALARVLEAVEDGPWHRFLRRELFEPLAMRSTGVPHEEPVEGAALTYRMGESGEFVVETPLRTDNPAAAGLWSSAQDLGRFLQLHLRGGEVDGVRLLERRNANRMRRGLSFDRQHQGMGWRTGPWPEPRFVWESTSTAVFSASTRAFPLANAGYVILANTGWNGMREVEDLVLAGMGEEEGIDRLRHNVALGGGPIVPPPSGPWSGNVLLPGATVEVQMVLGDEACELRCGEVVAAGKKVRITAHGVTAEFAPGRPLPGTSFRALPTWRFELHRRGDVLRGIAYAEADRFRLAHLVELRAD